MKYMYLNCEYKEYSSFVANTADRNTTQREYDRRREEFAARAHGLRQSPSGSSPGQMASCATPDRSPIGGTGAS